jgi:hypothetical protein
LYGARGYDDVRMNDVRPWRFVSAACAAFLIVSLLFVSVTGDLCQMGTCSGFGVRCDDAVCCMALIDVDANVIVTTSTVQIIASKSSISTSQSKSIFTCHATLAKSTFATTDIGAHECIRRRNYKRSMERWLRETAKLPTIEIITIIIAVATTIESTKSS